MAATVSSVELPQIVHRSELDIYHSYKNNNSWLCNDIIYCFFSQLTKTSLKIQMCALETQLAIITVTSTVIALVYNAVINCPL